MILYMPNKDFPLNIVVSPSVYTAYVKEILLHNQLIYMLFHRWTIAHDPDLCIMSLTVSASDASVWGMRVKG